MSATNKTAATVQDKVKEVKAKTPSPELAYSTMIAEDPDYATDGSLLYRWTGRIWEPQQPETLEREAFRWCGAHPDYFDRATPKLAASCAVASVINARRLPSSQHDDSIILPVRNGYLKIDAITGTAKIVEPSKTYGLTYEIDCDFDADAEPVEFNCFLSQVLPDAEVREWVQAYVGYTLMPDCRYQKATFWLGAGANGKSTLAEIVAGLHSKITSMTLSSLDGFKLVSLIGSSLVFVDETPSRIDEQQLKTLISGGLVQIDRKFREPLSLRPTAKWIVCGNSLPSISDQSHGFWRRLPVVTFDRQFAESEQDPLLAKRIIKTELSGVLNWALVGLVRVLSENRLPPPPAAMQKAADDGKRETNSVLAWIDDSNVDVDEGLETLRADVYRNYRSWGLDRGFSPVNETKFWMRLRAIDPAFARVIAKKVDGKKLRYSPIRLEWEAK